MNPQLDWCAPEACTLAPADQPDRVAEIDALFAESVRAVTATAGRARLVLERDGAVAARAADLAFRESQCCSFLTFRLEVNAESLSLDVVADAGHEEVVVAFAGRASRYARG